MNTLLILYTLLSGFLSTADNMPEELHTPEAAFQAKPVLEKVQVQLSEEVIAAGETLWFQGTLSGSQPESKVLYVEVLNSQQTVIQGIYSIKNAMSKGQIQMPDTLSGGWYQVRAYTQWMRNFGEGTYWSQPIMIINPYEDNLAIQQPQPASPSREIAFFPEGGNYVEGLPNRLLVQLSEEIMMDTIISSKIISPQDSLPIAEVQLQSGQGIFSIIPEADKDYALEMYLSNGDTLQEALPKPLGQGTTVQAHFEQNSLQIEVHHSKQGEHTLLLRTHDTLLHSEKYSEASFSYNFDDKDLPVGILEVRVLNATGKMLARRILYHAPAADAIQIALEKTNYHPREEVRANFSLGNITSLAEVAVSIRKVNPLTQYLEHNKNTFGLIDEDKMPESLNEAQRISRINQDLITKESPFQPLQNNTDAQPLRYSKEDETLTVSGKVKELSGKNAAGRVVVLSVPGTNPYFEYDFVDAEGSFEIPIKENVSGRKDIILQMADTSLQVEWVLDEKFMQETTYLAERFPAVPEAVLKEVLQAYTHRAQIHSQYDFYHTIDSTSIQKKKDFRFYGAPNFEISLEDYIELPNFVEVNRELMPGIRLRESKGRYNLDVFDIPSRTFLPGEPSVFLDGVLIHDLSYLVDFPPAEMELIETVNRRTYYGEYRFDGTIAIYTQDGNAYLPALSPSAKQEKVTLYTSPLAFSRTDSLQAHEPDFRTLLYWQPLLKLSNEPYALTFSNADELGEFEIIVEGMTEDGQQIYGRKTYTVSLNDLP